MYAGKQSDRYLTIGDKLADVMITVTDSIYEQNDIVNAGNFFSVINLKKKNLTRRNYNLQLF